MPSVQIFIATYNRPLLLEAAINSTLNQDFDSFEVIISDNSTNDETEKLISRFRDNRLKYIKRRPSLSSFTEHFNVIMQDVTAEYFMIFHDDDIMCENMVSTLINEIEKNKLAIAIGANAFVYINKRLQKKLFRKKNQNQIVKDRNEMAENYLNSDILPLPSYLYKREVATTLIFDFNSGGKHADVSFLMNVSDLGHVINMDTPLMYYHFHNSQVSSDFDYPALNSLTNYIIKTTRFIKTDNEILKFRAMHLYIHSLMRLKDPSNTMYGWRNRKTLRILFYVYPFNYFLKFCIKLILTKGDNYNFIKKIIK